jgi:hypothetical protein
VFAPGIATSTRDETTSGIHCLMAIADAHADGISVIIPLVPRGCKDGCTCR